MKIEYVSHACLLIETEDLLIATDPWLTDATYCGQWYLFPKPVNAERVKSADVVLISHGHEDHLHEATLREIPKNIRVFYPYSFFGGAKEYIESLGFRDVKECVTFKKYKISEKTNVTFVINSHDSLMVIESGGKVLINVNDALHSSPEKIIDFYVQEIRAKWQKIDYVFCGFGGASYFPNAMHLAGKDDYAIAIAREQLFAHNFCRVVQGLKPKIAVPFAADFCLLGDNQRWINKARFPRNKMADYYEKYFADGDGYAPKIVDMYSGDRLENDELKPLSPYRRRMENGELNHLIDEQYGAEIERKRVRKFINEAEAEKLIGEVRQNVEKRMTLFPAEKLKKLKFSLRLTDVAENAFYIISFDDGKANIRRADEADDDSLLTMNLSSAVLRYSIGSDWGADVVSIGYGAEIEISNKRAAEVDLESVCMNLLACYPTIKDLKKTPLRTMKFLLLNPPRFTTSIRKLKKFNQESENYDRKTWLLKPADEIRLKYNLPKLGSEFLPKK
ncbi:MAG: MBL fold metallo-hydrolase [Acidobacteriota bacterium]|nr:MBL fold metallo-hydrolase [Acidobacteriota bacterium]